MTESEAFSEIRIRPATPADLPAIGRLAAMLVRVHHEFDPDRFIPATPDTERGCASWLGSQLTTSSAIVLVAEHRGAVIGYSYAALEEQDWMVLRGPAGMIYDILVDPAHRGGGMGRLLLDATITELEMRGAPRVVLSTAARNESAQRLFARTGFRPTMIEMTRECTSRSPAPPL
ncbi:MAG: GNAT family N-acetyltransferase [Gemmatimonadaceae bacterium]|nr:GNAT family N-acetyltransferase [Gemmatimonadaceae bacterium]